MNDRPHNRGIDGKELAARFGTSESFVAKMRVRGDGPPFTKIGRRVIYLESDIDTWLAGRKFNSTSQVAA
jgi:predicted DNA-binding transcriptional regulator AlpA